jgi:hypothetical protein
MSTVTLRCSGCRHELTWISGGALCPNPSCGGHDAGREVEVVSRRERDRAFELATLRRAAERSPIPAAGEPLFVATVIERLEVGAREYGDGWSARPLTDLLAEVAEEAADIGGWAVLALQSLDGLGAQERDVVRACVLDAVEAGARAHAMVTLAIGELGRAVPPAGEVA